VGKSFFTVLAFDKNLLWDELNVLKEKLNVKSKKTSEVYR